MYCTFAVRQYKWLSPSSTEPVFIVERCAAFVTVYKMEPLRDFKLVQTADFTDPPNNLLEQYFHVGEINVLLKLYCDCWCFCLISS